MIERYFGPAIPGFAVFADNPLFVQECVRVQKAWGPLSDTPLLLSDVMGEIVRNIYAHRESFTKSGITEFEAAVYETM